MKYKIIWYGHNILNDSIETKWEQDLEFDTKEELIDFAEYELKRQIKQYTKYVEKNLFWRDIYEIKEVKNEKTNKHSN